MTTHREHYIKMQSMLDMDAMAALAFMSAAYLDDNTAPSDIWPGTDTKTNPCAVIFLCFSLFGPRKEESIDDRDLTHKFNSWPALFANNHYYTEVLQVTTTPDFVESVPVRATADHTLEAYADTILRGFKGFSDVDSPFLYGKPIDVTENQLDYSICSMLDEACKWCPPGTMRLFNTVPYVFKKRVDIQNYDFRHYKYIASFKMDGYLKVLVGSHGTMFNRETDHYDIPFVRYTEWCYDLVAIWVSTMKRASVLRRGVTKASAKLMEKFISLSDSDDSDDEPSPKRERKEKE